MAETPVGPGTLLAGRFVLEDLLDDTEGARFWRATDKILARSVAVHVISAEDPRSEALLNAARTSATVSDGHLLRVLDAATEDGITYVVNEWGHGISLDRLLAEGPLSPRRAAWVVKEVAEAISTAHRHGIAHGRLLPENVMVTEAGSVKLIGFVVDAVLRGRDQARVTGGRPLGEHEADVVNLASLLYAGLVARWPGTDGSTVPAAPVEHGRTMRPRQVRAGVPRPLDAVCERVLNADPASATTPLETAHEIYAALCDFIGDPSAAAQAGFEATSFFDEEELAHLRGDAPRPDHEVTDTGEQDALDATQAGAPVFSDEDTSVGWARGGAGTAAGAAAGAGVADDPEATQVSPAPRAERSPAPDLPPLPDRPLFASDTPRAPRPEARPGSTGAGNGPLPPVWGPDADAPAPTDPSRPWETSAWDDDPPGRSWMRLALAIGGVLVLVVAIIVAFNLGQGTGPTDAEESPSAEPSSAAAEPVTIAGVSDFDPEGDGTENPDTAPLAVDGDPSSAWRTVTYYDPLEAQKGGVGLLVDLGRPDEGLRGLVLVRRQPHLVRGARRRRRLRGADHRRRASPAWAARRTPAPKADVTLDQPVTTQYLVVWLTSLPSASGGYVGQIAEIVVR